LGAAQVRHAVGTRRQGGSLRNLHDSGDLTSTVATARMEKAEKDLNEARIAWAATVRDLGQAAVARELGLTSQGIAERLRVIEGKKTR
jgi:hypothetical protein